MPELRIVLTMIALLAAMVISGMIGRRNRLGIAVLALLSFVWLTVDKDFEGAVLVTVMRHNGLTLADLVGLAGFAVCAILWWRTRR
jgi:hypothetical protein